MLGLHPPFWTPGTNHPTCQKITSRSAYSPVHLLEKCTWIISLATSFAWSSYTAGRGFSRCMLCALLTQRNHKLGSKARPPAQVGEVTHPGDGHTGTSALPNLALLLGEGDVTHRAWKFWHPFAPKLHFFFVSTFAATTGKSTKKPGKVSKINA